MEISGYIRVSTLRQADEGQSLEVQRRSIEGYAMMLGKKIDHLFVESGVSGSIRLQDRPEGGRMMTSLKAGDMVITPKLDRMFRSALDALDVLKIFKSRDVQLHMLDLGGDVTGNGISKLVFTILSAVAEAERDRTTERIKEVKADQKRHNKFLGGKLPYGYQVDKLNGNQLVPDERQQKFIEAMLAGAAERYPLRAIQMAVFNLSHHFPPIEKPSLVTISRILKAKGIAKYSTKRTSEREPGNG
jgi:putative DNA-invertase from lambdoid prophage Rac